GNVQLAGKFDEALVYDPLVGNAVVCQFEVEPVRSEGIAVPGCNLARLVQAISAYELGNFATHTAGKGHEVVLEKRHKFLVNSRLVVEALCVARGTEFHEVAVAPVACCEQHKSVVLVGAFGGRPVVAALECHVEVASNYWSNGTVARSAAQVEAQSAKEVPIVGEGNGLHAEFAGAGDKVGYSGTCSQEGEFAVIVQVDEFGVGHSRRQATPIPGTCTVRTGSPQEPRA